MTNAAIIAAIYTAILGLVGVVLRAAKARNAAERAADTDMTHDYAHDDEFGARLTVVEPRGATR